MSILFQADNDLKRVIADATLRREPSIDFQTALIWADEHLNDWINLIVKSTSDEELTFGLSIQQRKNALRLVDLCAERGRYAQ